MNTYSIIIEQNLTRIQALALKKITDKHGARNGGAQPSAQHRKPKPRFDTIQDYVNHYNEPHNSSTGGRY